ncbi:hypothetical protein BDV95DRAFT_606371 [Massariosphaeria phaeospora]|uniref:Peptidase C15, pyroglutamyl peptidase I-like protein n=1 Tax=Massariosphaeria phaeospora TaxID=100035 RepID=A0A7C8MBL6_9PLEO|nr:hypothetical protein BDV95DRAFT_606371 [Massariosphaeria phaeospora]
MTKSTPPDEVRVLVTGFGPFLDITTNPSWEIARALPPDLQSSHPSSRIRLIVPASPLPAAYHPILAQTTALIDQHDPHLIVHIGLAVDRDYFAVEQSAAKDGYHDIPDVDRKVFTRAENKKVFGKAAEELRTALDLEAAVGAWQGACSGIVATRKEGGKKKKKTAKELARAVDVRLSDDVGTFVCGFAYYVSLLEMQKRWGRRDVVFLHVPRLEGAEEVRGGVEVTKALIRVLVEGQ